MISSVGQHRRVAILVAILVAVGLAVAGVFASISGSALADDPHGFTIVTQPSISGDQTVGSTLTADPGVWNPTPDSFSYQWYRYVPGPGAQNTAIPDATTSTYETTADDAGASIQVEVTAHKTGLSDLVEYSYTNIQIPGQTITPGVPTISGTATVGSTLTVDPGTWAPANTTFEYQWLRNGYSIRSGSNVDPTSSTYVLSARDAGQDISVQVFGDAAGYSSNEAYSDSEHVAGTGYTVSGTLTGILPGDTTASPLSDIDVELYEQGSDYPVEVDDHYTDSDGHFEFDFGPTAPTSKYTLDINDNPNGYAPGVDFIHEWRGGSADEDLATYFTLTPSNTSQSEDYQLDQAATITGVVKDADGNPIDGAYVAAEAPGATIGAYGTSASDGSYTLNQVSSNETIVSAGATKQSNSAQDTIFYNTQYWDHASTAAAATPVSITPGQNTPAIDFDLSVAPSISGRVVDANGNGVSSMGYSPEEYDASTGQYAGPQYGPIVTDDQGYFKQRAEVGGSYRFGFSDYAPNEYSGNYPRTARYDSTWYSDAASLDTATPIDVTENDQQKDLGNIVVTQHTGGPAFESTPRIEADSFATDGSLDVVGGDVSPGDATLSYQWYRDGVPIDGTTTYGYYTPVPADHGHVLTVAITATIDGFPPVTSATSAGYDLRDQFIVTTPAAFSGTAQVGSTLTATPGSLTPAPDAVTYQWYRDDTDHPIDAATESTYLLTPADLNAHVFVVVTSTKAGYRDNVQQTTAVAGTAAGNLTATVPTITGTLKAGSTLTAHADGWGPGTVDLSYQWSNSDGPISGATDSTYALSPTDVGKTLTVTVTGTATGYAAQSQTSVPTESVATGPFSTKGVPTVTSNGSLTTPTFGDVLTAHPGTWAPGSPTFTYEWFQGSTDTGASGPTYTLGTSDLGTTISVRVTATEDGFVTDSADSTPTNAVGTASFTSVATPTISGPNGQGQFTASAGSSVPAPSGTTYAYQWYANDVLVAGATGSTFAPDPSLEGDTLTVTVTASADGYSDSTSAKSAASSPVPAGILGTSVPTVTGTAKVGATLTAAVAPWSPDPVALSYQWIRGDCLTGTPVGTDSATYVLQPADLGQTICVRVTGTKAHYASKTVASASTASVVAGDLTTSAPTITGTLKNGSTLTANTDGWGPGTVDKSYQWSNAAGPILGATDSTYVLKASDVGTNITVTVTGTETGYSPTTKTSLATDTIGAGPFATKGQPTITSTGSLATPTFGDVLTAHPGTWTPGSPTFTYEWFQGSTDTGVSGSTYTLGTSDIGKTVSVRVTAAEDGFVTDSADSAQTSTVIAASFSSVATPSISRVSSAGHKFTANGAASVPSTATFTYQWYANGTLVPDVTGASFTSADHQSLAGDTLTVTVTATNDGYTPLVSALSAPSADTIPVVKGTLTTTVPTITGTAKVGSTLTANVDPWGPDPVALTYLWEQNCDSAKQVGTAATYVVTSADVQSTLCVRVTGTKGTDYDPATTVSAQTAVVAKGDLTPTPTPTITGTPTFGHTLTAVPGTWGPGSVTLHFQWNDADGAIAGATSPTYTIGEVTSAITVTVTGSESGYSDVSHTSDPTEAVATVNFGTITTPSIVPTSAKVGTVLSATTSPWSPTAALAYQWYRGAEQIPAPAGTGATYTVTGDDLGAAISAQVTGTRLGYTTATKTSDPVTPMGVFTTAPKPTITGTAQVGKTLNATHGTWVPSPTGISYSYTWKAGATTLDETGATHQVTAADSGKTITVAITASATGYTDLTSAASSATKKVVTGTLASATPTVSDTTPVTNESLTAVTGTWTPGTTFKYQWYRGSTAISAGKSASYTPTGSDYGHALKVKVTGSLAGYTSVSKTSASTKDVAKGTLTTSDPVVTGTLAVGSVVTASVPAWTPSTVTMKYQWYRSKTATGTFSSISGATSHTYTLGSTSVGYYIEVKVTGSKTGYTTVTKTSAASESPVVKGEFTTSPTPTVSGTIVVGSTLTAAHGTWAPSSSLTYAYQWFRGDSAISKATKSTYKLASADAGSPISVRVTVTKSGFTPGVEPSAATPNIFTTADVSAFGKPSITGTAQHGQTLTASWDGLPDGATLSYQWYRVNGSSSTSISGATASTYTISGSSLYTGKTIKVKVTAQLDGHTLAAVYSSSTAKVS